MPPDQELRQHLPRSAICELGSASTATQAALRGLRDAGQEVVYVGALDADHPELDRRLAAVCVQEDVDALVLLGEVPADLPDRVRGRLAEGDDSIAVLLAGPDLTERVAEAARRP